MNCTIVHVSKRTSEIGHLQFMHSGSDIVTILSGFVELY